MRRKIIPIIITAVLIAASAGILRAGDEELWMTATTPDALIILDLSGSMDEIPLGSNPTLYLHGSTDCDSSGPFYATNTGDECLAPSPATLYAANCATDGPYATTPTTGTMPTVNLWVTGTNCTTSYNGPYSYTIGSGCLNMASSTVYASTSSCTSTSAVYYINSASGHTKKCSITNMPTITYTASNCVSGPFYRSSGTGHTTSCTKSCTNCSSPFSGASGAYTASDCTNTGGPFYRSSGSGHTTLCPATSSTCTINSDMYTANSCSVNSTSGPFYKSSGSGHTTLCYAQCNTACTPGGKSVIWSTSSCEGPFYSSSGTGHTTNCSKKQIAKRSLFTLLDADGDNSITSADNTSLNMRLGFMRYYNCGGSDNDSSSTPWTSGCEKLSWGITQSDNITTTPYANLFCNNTTCASTVTSCTATSPAKECIAGYSATGGTPLGDALKEGKKYLDYHKALDASASCRSKSIIVITDGADTYSCGSTGSYTGPSQRRAPVFYAKQAHDTKYDVYVVGFGASMPDELKNTLNWTAYYGNTRNPNEVQTVVSTPPAVVVGTDPCSNGTDPGNQTLSGYAFMASNPAQLAIALQTAITSIQEATYSFSPHASVTATRTEYDKYLYTATFEPKNTAGLSKEPFWTGHLTKYEIGNDGTIMTQAVWDAGKVLAERDPAYRNMWTCKHTTNCSGNLIEFNTTNIAAADLAVADNTRRDEVVGFYRGEATYNLENWKLGDPFHANPAPIRMPTQFFYDPRECGATNYRVYQQRDANKRSPTDGTQVMLIGANDGQLHAFRTNDGEEIWSFIPPNLLQKLQILAHNSHADRASLPQYHDAFVDGFLQISDVWLPGSWGIGWPKSADDFKTIAIFGEGKGSGNYLWSTSPTCYSSTASDFQSGYDSTHNYYCGFYALDVTNSTETPGFLWHLKGNGTNGAMLPAEGQYLGQAWSNMQTGRVMDGGNEKWVGFIGGGVDPTDPTGTTSNAGKGFFVVDLKTGQILWKFTYGATATSTSAGGTSPLMTFPMPASPMPVDLDNDGFIDTVYVGDLGGNMWRFRLCPRDPNCSSCGSASYTGPSCTSCTTLDWKGRLLFQSSDAERGSSKMHKQIFTTAKASLDDKNNVWVFFATGQYDNPTWKPTVDDPETSYTKNRIYAIKEDTHWIDNTNFTAIYSTALTDDAHKLVDITSDTYVDSDKKHGWYINLSTNSVTTLDGDVITNPVGEKIVTDPTIFGGEVWFPAYLPAQVSTSACGLMGYTILYKLNYLTGGGQWDDAKAAAAKAAYDAAKANPGDLDLAAAAKDAANATIDYRTKGTGHGIGSAVLVSYGPDFHAQTYIGSDLLGPAKTDANMTKILYWKDKRVE